jgi:hypothetical protein
MAVWPTILAGQKITADLLTSMIPTTVTKTSVSDKTNTTLTDDPELSIPVEAGATYIIRMEIIASGLLAAGFKTAWSVPTGTSNLRRVLGPGTSASNGNADDIAMRMGCHLFATPVTYGAARNSAGAQFHVVETANVTIGSTAGNVTFQWAQTTANATASRVWNGSFIWMQRIG